MSLEFKWDAYITPEGKFEVVLYGKSEFNEKEHKSVRQFVTNDDGVYPAKSPVGMFDGLYIPNDLGYVVKKSEELNKMIFIENNIIKIDKVEKVDQNENYLIFYVKKQNKSEIIGKNGKNIKKIRKEYGNVIIKVI